jgi:transcription elongation factor Elf1
MKGLEVGGSERDSPEGSDESDLSLKNEHVGGGEFRCNECNKVFNKICYLKQHNKSFHNGEKPFKCTQCGKRFPVEVLYQVI